jgi:hypothetical protein
MDTAKSSKRKIGPLMVCTAGELLDDNFNGQTSLHIPNWPTEQEESVTVWICYDQADVNALRSLDGFDDDAATLDQVLFDQYKGKNLHVRIAWPRNEAGCSFFQDAAHKSAVYAPAEQILSKDFSPGLSGWLDRMLRGQVDPEWQGMPWDPIDRENLWVFLFREFMDARSWKEICAKFPAQTALRVDHGNTLRAYKFSAFRQLVNNDPKEILGFHMAKPDVAIISSVTNGGKTTLLRNVALCMAAGRPFMPFYEGNRPVRVIYFDFEDDWEDSQDDYLTMVKRFGPAEITHIDENLCMVPMATLNGELFQFNTGTNTAIQFIQDHQAEFVIIDNISAAYDINDENSNAEVRKKIIKPLKAMAYRTNSAFLFAHHFGKAKVETGSPNVHSGRGASTLADLAKTVINMTGDVSNGEPSVVTCSKRKRDGGQCYSESFKLTADRWFEPSTFQIPPPPPGLEVQILRWAVNTFGEMVPFATAAIQQQFGDDAIKGRSRSSILAKIKVLKDSGDFVPAGAGNVMVAQKHAKGSAVGNAFCKCPRRGEAGETCPVCYAKFEE